MFTSISFNCNYYYITTERVWNVTITTVFKKNIKTMTIYFFVTVKLETVTNIDVN